MGKLGDLLISCYCRFVSFCRLGAGLSDDELGAVVTKLKPYFRYLLDKWILEPTDHCLDFDAFGYKADEMAFAMVLNQ